MQSTEADGSHLRRPKKASGKAKMTEQLKAPRGPRSPWSTLPQTETNIQKLYLLCHSDKERRKEGYVLQDLSGNELLSKLKCSFCNARRKEVVKSYATGLDTAARSAKLSSLSLEYSSPSNSNRRKDRCYFHPGRNIRPAKVWSCCMRHVSAKGCTVKDQHDFGSEQDAKFRANWKYHAATEQSGTSLAYRAAVCIDMEMGYATTGYPEVIRVTAIDFFTQEVLIDRLVSPNVRMRHLNTRYSGITQHQMAAAVQSKACYFGRDAARDALFRFVGPHTIIVAHSGSNDLHALRILHPHVVDTFILEGYSGVKTPGGRSLKNLTKVHTGLDIQMAQGHDSLEDSLACRELAVASLKMIPDDDLSKELKNP